MRVIIINDSKDYMANLRRMLASVIPSVEVTEFDATQGDRPNADFDWSLYDLLIIEDRLGGKESGLAWIAVFSIAAELPPTLLLTEEKDGFVESKVEELESTAYVLKNELSQETIKAVLAEVGIAGTNLAALNTIQSYKFEHDREIVDKFMLIEGSAGGDQNSYKFVRLIGQGAHSRVYLAERLDDKQTVVLKVIELRSVDDELLARRFAREAELLAEIDSPYVVKFFGHGFKPNFGYIAIEFFTRGDLKQRIEHGVNREEALLYALNIGFGLEAIHAKNIVHRDLKPGNIMFRSDDSLALADFGISKHLGGSWDLTKTGSILGTLNYLSPEQGLGQTVDHRTDLYGLGIILFEMLAGEKAFQASTPGALVYQHLYADVPKLPDAVAEFQPIVDKLLAKNPDERFNDASEFVATIQPYCA
ncbi:MAG: serine/threonine-protein kinase [Gammaproteobacteria bacterium]